jgi:hypothetical protein
MAVEGTGCQIKRLPLEKGKDGNEHRWNSLAGRNEEDGLRKRKKARIRMREEEEADKLDDGRRGGGWKNRRRGAAGHTGVEEADTYNEDMMKMDEDRIKPAGGKWAEAMDECGCGGKECFLLPIEGQLGFWTNGCGGG